MYKIIMNSKTKSMLDYAINSLELGTEVYTMLDNLFYIYASQEINDFDDILNAPAEFCGYVLENYNFICAANPLLNENDLYDVILNYEQMLYSYTSDENIKAQQEYVSIVEGLTPNKNTTNVIDVASGAVPISSIQMANDLSNVYAIDSFIIPTESLKKMNVNAFYGYISPDSAFSKFDFAVARHPCDATIPLIQLCAKNNLPYLIDFCLCGLQKSTKHKIPADWQENLRKIDPRIKFSVFEVKRGGFSIKKRYGYVMNASQREIDEFLKHSASGDITENEIKSLKELFIQNCQSAKQKL